MSWFEVVGCSGVDAVTGISVLPLPKFEGIAAVMSFGAIAVKSHKESEVDEVDGSDEFTVDDEFVFSIPGKKHV